MRSKSFRYKTTLFKCFNWVQISYPTCSSIKFFGIGATMSFFTSYLDEIIKRKEQKLNPKPIETSGLAAEIISQIKDPDSNYREESLRFLIYNTLPGTTNAASVKANFLKEIIQGNFLQSLFTNCFYKTLFYFFTICFLFLQSLFF